MNWKISTLILALALGVTPHAEEATHSGHEHSSPDAKTAPAKTAPAKTAPAKAPEGKSPAEAKEIKSAAKSAKCKPHKAAKADCFHCHPELKKAGK